MNNRKRIELALLSLSLSLYAMAGTIDVTKAASKAVKMLGKEVVTTNTLTTKVRARVATQSASPAYYIFNAADGKGFVIISGEEAMPELVGYSYTNTFDEANMHPGLVDMLDYYTQVVNDVRAGEVEVDYRPMLRAPKVLAGPLCKVQWGQDEPYNTLCPEDNGVKCPVGCVATAMAQIMYHFEWPKVGEGSLRYACSLPGVSILSSNFSEHEYVWSEMKATKKDNMASETAAAAVAQLSYDCGIASRMDYTAEGSGTLDDQAMYAMYTHFGYKASPLRIEYRNCYATQEEWNDLVKSEINANRPVLYAGHDSNGNGGHEFIVDGYDEEDNFHVNWGWDGKSDGYYAIFTLHPSNSRYTFKESQSMICGIEPDPSGEDKTPPQWRMYLYNAPSVKKDTCQIGEKFTYTLGEFYNHAGLAHTWTYGAALYSLDGEQLAMLTKVTDKNTHQVLSYYYGHNAQSTVSIAIPEGTADGYYALRTVFRQREKDANGQEIYKDFVLPNMEGGQALNNVFIKVENGDVIFNVELPAAIDQIAANPLQSHSIYNLYGQPQHGLQRGINIVNGKKILVK